VFAFALALAIVPATATAERIVLEYDFDSPELAPAAEGSVVVRSPGCATFNEPGLPLLPARRAAVLLPPGHRVTAVRAVASSPSTLTGHHVVAHAVTPRPISDPGPFPPTLAEPSVYQSDASYPPEAARLVTEQTSWGHKIAYLRVYPVAYHPLSGLLTSYERVRLEIDTELAPGADPASLPNLRRDAATVERLRSMVANPEALDGYTGSRAAPVANHRIDPDNYPYVIVTTAGMAEAYHGLAVYESSRGWRTKIMLIEEITDLYPGLDSAERLRNFVIDAFNTWGTRYLMLGGDSDAVPVRNLYVDAGGTIDAFPGDCYYEALDGNWNTDLDELWGEPGEEDFAGELAAGRITARTPADLAKWMHKNSMYAEDPVVAELQKALFLGERMDDVPTYACIYMDDVKDYCCDWGYCTSGYPDGFQKQMLCDGPGYEWGSGDVIALFNSGYPTSHHLGHANTTYGMKMSNPDAARFTNDGVTHSYAFMSTQGCYSNNFDNGGSQAISEAFTLDDNCAVAFLGNTRYGWYCPGYDIGPSQHYDREFVDAVYGEGITLVGDANVDSKIDVVWQMDPWNRWCHYELCLLGDPAMPQWNNYVSPLTVSYAGTYVMGQGPTTITVRSGSFPVPQATVTIYTDDLSVCVTGTTNYQGQVTLTPQPADIAPLRIKAVKPAYRPGTGTMTVDPGQQPWLTWSATEIDDDQDGGSFGDGDGQADMGETVQLRVTLRNVGHAPAPNTVVTLSCADPRIEIADGVASYGTIEPESDGTNSDDLLIRVPLGIADLDVACFQVQMACGGHTPWDGAFDVLLHAPVLTLHSWTFDDTVTGDGNGKLSPGEVFQVRVVLENTGSDGAREVQATLSSTEPLVGMLTAEAGVPLVPAAGQSELSPPFQAVLDPAMPTEAMIRFDLSVVTWCGQTLAAGFEVRVASLVEELFEADSFWTVGAPGDDATQGLWVRVDPIGTYVYGQPAQTEDDHTPEGVACFVTKQGGIGAPANQGDVDGGRTTLTSPIYDLTQAVEPRLVYWRWYTNNLAQNPNEDFWQVDVSSDGGATWVNLENTSESANSWVRMEFDLSNYIQLTSRVRLRFIASDEGNDSCVEAALDDLSIESGRSPTSLEPTSSAPRFGIERLAPNPAFGSGAGSTIEFALSQGGDVALRLYHVDGKLAATLIQRSMPAGVHRLHWAARDEAGRPIPAGLYFLRLESAGQSEVRKVTLIH